MKFSNSEMASIEFHASNEVDFEAILTKEGIWKGVYRPGDLIKQSAPWVVGKPVTWGHPSISSGGRATPEMAVGRVLGSEYIPDGHQLKVTGVLWPDKIPPEGFRRLQAGEHLDISGGFAVPELPEAGVWKGQEYKSREFGAINWDHASVVSLGACSQRDGCGLKLKGHSADIEKINREYNRRLGRRVA